MTIKEAINQLIDSEKFKEDCRHDARMRVFLHRLRNGTAKREMILSVLGKYGFKVEVSVLPGRRSPA